MVHLDDHPFGAGLYGCAAMPPQNARVMALRVTIWLRHPSGLTPSRLWRCALPLALDTPDKASHVRLTAGFSPAKRPVYQEGGGAWVAGGDASRPML